VETKVGHKTGSTCSVGTANGDPICKKHTCQLLTRIWFWSHKTEGQTDI